MMRLVPIICALMMAPAPLLAGVAELRAAAEAFAGQPVLLDPRLRLPSCASNAELDWNDERKRTLVARCGGWSMAIPVSGPARSRLPAERPADWNLRRGDRVTVEAGRGAVRVALDAIVEAQPDRSGRMAVRNSVSGQRLTAIPSQSGGWRLAGRGADSFANAN